MKMKQLKRDEARLMLDAITPYLEELGEKYNIKLNDRSKKMLMRNIVIDDLNNCGWKLISRRKDGEAIEKFNF